MSIRDHISRRSNYEQTLDFIPTPPYATRVLFEYVAPSMKAQAPEMTMWDPACGAGHMCTVFEEYGAKSIASDVHFYGFSDTRIQDFVAPSLLDCYKDADAIVTNPPYAKLNKFMIEGLDRSKRHFALLTRIQALEGQNRHKDVFSKAPPTTVAVFSDRIPFKSGEVVRKVSKMFTHCWLYWDMEVVRSGAGYEPKITWVPVEAQQNLEKDEDYA